MTTNRYPFDQDDPLARARREAARLITTLADLEAARHYGLRAQAREHTERMVGIMLGLQVDVDAIRRELAGTEPEPEPEPEPGPELLRLDEDCPDCGHTAGVHDSLAYRAATPEAEWIGCVWRPVNGGDRCGCLRVYDPSEVEATEPADVPPGLTTADMLALDPPPSESELRVLDGNR